MVMLADAASAIEAVVLFTLVRDAAPASADQTGKPLETFRTCPSLPTAKRVVVPPDL
jgi:hypothetical protein